MSTIVQILPDLKVQFVVKKGTCTNFAGLKKYVKKGTVLYEIFFTWNKQQSNNWSDFVNQASYLDHILKIDQLL